MSLAHPRTMALRDPALPEVAVLLGQDPPQPLVATVGAHDGDLLSARAVQVSWSPGRSITVRYQVEVSGGPLHGGQVLVCAAGRVPEGSLVVEGDDGERIGVWRFPHDPALPGLPSALDDRTASELLVDLGADPAPVRTTLRAYRPARRAVVEVKAPSHRVFLKVVRPRAIEGLHRIHRALADTLPVPASLGYDEGQGLVALQALGGATLRQTLASPTAPVPSAGEVAGLVATLPHPDDLVPAASPKERTPRMIALLTTITPELEPRLESIGERIGTETLPANRPVHGDYYEAQLMVDDGRIVGVLDVDTYGLGRAGDDPATMLGHLSVWGPMSPHPRRVLALGNDLLRVWDGQVDPVDLRLRSAAVALSLASGPFRVQSATWPGEVADRVAIAERWLESATRVDERNLIPFSG